jgi:peptide/nickel transport system ATP-binding protein
MIILRDLDVRFGAGAHATHAVKELSLSFGSGVAYGLVGESGCGKTTVLRAIAGLIPNWTGQIEIAGQLQEKTRDKAFYRKVQMVFQDPYASLHPRQTVDEVLAEPLKVHGLDAIDRRVLDALDDVNLDGEVRYRYPHELSGGQRQRVALARALILRPEILLLDEPTSSLDTQVQAEILHLLGRLQSHYGLTYLLVSHNLAVIAELCQWAAVMRDGRVEDVLRTADLADGAPANPYVQELLTASRGYTRPRAGKTTPIPGAPETRRE